MLLDGLAELAFYVTKYSGDILDDAKELLPLMKRAFEGELATKSQHEFLMLTGASAYVLNRMSPAVKATLWEAIHFVLRRESHGVYHYFGDDRHQMKIPAPSASLNWILLASAVCSTESILENLLRRVGFGSAFIDRWISAYSAFRSNLASVLERGPNYSDLNGFVSRCAIANVNNHDLFRRNLDERIDKFSKQECGEREFRQFTKCWATLLSRNDVIEIENFVPGDWHFGVSIGEDLSFYGLRGNLQASSVTRNILYQLGLDSELMRVWSASESQ